MFLTPPRQIAAYRTGQKQDHDDGSRDPERAIEVRISVENVEEIGARVEGGLAPTEHFGGVDVEELRVE